MADILASVSVVLGAEISGFKAAMAQARRELKGLVQFSEGLKDIGTSLTQYVSLPLAAMGGASVVASAKLDSLKRGLQAIAQQELGKQGVTGLSAMQLAAESTTQRIKELQVIAKQPGLGLETAEQADIRLRAVGTSAEQSAKEIKAFANAIATTGGGRTEFQTVTTQLSQMTAKSKVLAQDLRPIIEAAPAVAAALQTLYGTVDSETISASLAKQGKSSKDFVAILTDELAKLPQVSGGLKAIYENDLDAALVAGAQFGDGIVKAFNLESVGKRLGDGISALGNGFASLSPGVQQLIVGFGAVAVATGPLLVAIGTLGAALPSITAGFSVLGVTSLAALGPIAIGVAAVAVGAALIIDHWGELVDYFSPAGEGGQVFSNLADSVGNSINQISTAFSALNGGGDFSALVAATGIFKAIFRDVAVGVTAVSDVLGGVIGTVTNFAIGIKQAFTGEKITGFSAALGQLQRAAGGLIDPLANVFGFTKKAQEGFEGAAEGGGRFGTSLLQLSGVLTGFNTQLQGFAGGLPQYGNALNAQSGLLEKLRERLKEVTEQREKETSARAVSIDNALIKNLQAQIDALLGISKGAKQAQKDIKALSTELMALRVADVVAAMFKPKDFKLEGLLGKELPEVKLKPIDSVAFTASVNNATSQLARFQKVAEDFNAGLSQVLVGGARDIAISFGEAIGNIVSGAAGLDSLGAALLAPIGKMITQLGELAIAAGIGIGAIKEAFQTLNPVVAVAAGIALVALGAAVSGAAKSIGSSGGGSASASTGISTPKVSNYGQTSNQTTVKVIAEFRLRGKDFVAFGQQKDYRSKVTG